MRRAFHVIVLLLFTLYVQSGAMTWAVYYLFADDIAAAFCVNPTNPACHGRCHMTQITEKQQKHDAPGVEINIEKPLPFVSGWSQPVAFTDMLTTLYHSADAPLIDGVSTEIDHPPPILS